jgi:hypothetical protein
MMVVLIKKNRNLKDWNLLVGPFDRFFGRFKSEPREKVKKWTKNIKNFGMIFVKHL